MTNENIGLPCHQKYSVTLKMAKFVFGPRWGSRDGSRDALQALPITPGVALHLRRLMPHPTPNPGLRHCAYLLTYFQYSARKSAANKRLGHPLPRNSQKGWRVERYHGSVCASNTLYLYTRPERRLSTASTCLSLQTPNERLPTADPLGTPR